MVVLASVPSPSTSSAHTASRQGSTCFIVVSSGCRIAAPQRKEHIHIALGNRTVWHHHANRADGCIPDVFVSLHWARRHFDWIARVGSRRQLDLRHSRCVSSCCFRICLQAYLCMCSFCCFIFSRSLSLPLSCYPAARMFFQHCRLPRSKPRQSVILRLCSTCSHGLDEYSGTRRVPL